MPTSGHSPGGEGDGGSIFWKTREIGLPSYSNNLSTIDGIFCSLYTCDLDTSTNNMRKTVKFLINFFIFHFVKNIFYLKVMPGGGISLKIRDICEDFGYKDKDVEDLSHNLGVKHLEIIF